MSTKIVVSFFIVLVFQLDAVICAPYPLSAVGSASPSDGHGGNSPSFANSASAGHGLNQKYGSGYDPNQQQFNQLNPPYGIQRPPMYYPAPPFNNPQPFQIPINFYDNGNGLYFSNGFRPPNGPQGSLFNPFSSGSAEHLPNQSFGPSQYPGQQQYPIGSQSQSPYQVQGGAVPLSPFSRSSMVSQRKSDDLSKKQSH